MVSGLSKGSTVGERAVKLTSLNKAKYIAKLSDNKKGKNIIVLDLRKTGFISDFFIIVSGTSDTHVRAIANYIEETLKIKGERISHVERDTKDTWILLDYIDVVVNVFHEETRKYYNLERLWGDSKIIKWQKKK